MIRKIKKKYKKDEQRSSLITVLLVFYLFLSLFMIIVGMISFLKISNQVLIGNTTEILNTKLSILFYIIIIMFIGFLMLIGTIAGLVGLIKIDMKWLLYSIILLIISTLLFVVMDGYFTAIYSIMNYFNYFINILALISSSCLLIYSYNKQKHNI